MLHIDKNLCHIINVFQYHVTWILCKKCHEANVTYFYFNWFEVLSVLRHTFAGIDWDIFTKWHCVGKRFFHSFNRQDFFPFLIFRSYTERERHTHTHKQIQTHFSFIKWQVVNQIEKIENSIDKSFIRVRAIFKCRNLLKTFFFKMRFFFAWRVNCGNCSGKKSFSS